VKTLHAKIGELTLENDFLERALGKAGWLSASDDRPRAHAVTRQAEALGISRGSVYYLPRPVSDADLKLMRRIDELHLEYPFAGARMLCDLLRTNGHKAGRKTTHDAAKVVDASARAGPPKSRRGTFRGSERGERVERVSACR
jgi:putative transposase